MVFPVVLLKDNGKKLFRNLEHSILKLERTKSHLMFNETCYNIVFFSLQWQSFLTMKLVSIITKQSLHSLQAWCTSIGPSYICWLMQKFCESSMMLIQINIFQHLKFFKRPLVAPISCGLHAPLFPNSIAILCERFALTWTDQKWVCFQFHRWENILR